MKILARTAAVLASAFCFLGGGWILSRGLLTPKDDILATAIGFYFVGKAFFVGPMLWLAAGKAICTAGAHLNEPPPPARQRNPPPVHNVPQPVS